MKACITRRSGSKSAVAAKTRNPVNATSGAVTAKMIQNRAVTSSFTFLPPRSATRRLGDHARLGHPIACVQPAIDDQRLPVEISRRVAAKPCNRLGDLFGGRQVSGGQRLGDTLANHLPRCSRVVSRGIGVD